MPDLVLARRDRLLAAMAAAGLDAVVLGRPGDVRFASGVEPVWMSGARLLGPGCVVIAATGRVHVMSTWDEDVPTAIARDQLYGRAINPAVLEASLAEIPGLPAARRIGTDSSSPDLRRMLTAVAPAADLVDAGPALRAAGAVKVAGELACIQWATAVAEGSLAAMVAALRPGVTERQLLGVHLEHIAHLGATTPPTEAVACATERVGPVRLRRLATAEPIAEGTLVVLDPSALVDGYEGGLGRTVPVGAATPAQVELADRAAAGMAALVAACRAGATGADLRDAWAGTGEPLPDGPFVHGVGLGMERPVIGATTGHDEVLVAGAVVSLSSWVTAVGVGGHLQRDLVVVGDDRSEPLPRRQPA